MDFEISKSFKYLESALNARALRQDLIASNIANVDTPYYRPKDIDFENILNQKAHEEFGKDKPKELELAKTSEGKNLEPLDTNNNQPTIFYRDGHLAKNDGNSVDLDVETTELSKNGIMYSALTAALKKESMLFKAVVDSSKNI
jgi:flagellar basal-body rod protein FlgB